VLVCEIEEVQEDKIELILQIQILAVFLISTVEVSSPVRQPNDCDKCDKARSRDEK